MSAWRPSEPASRATQRRRPGGRDENSPDRGRYDRNGGGWRIAGEDFDIAVAWNNNEVSRYIGTVGDNGIVCGTSTNNAAKTGVRGAEIGSLKDGQGMVLERPCADGWCLVNSGFHEPRGYGFVQESQIRFD